MALMPTDLPEPVVPATNTVVQPEMEAMRPSGVTNHVTRMLLPPRPYDDQSAYKKALETTGGKRC